MNIKNNPAGRLYDILSAAAEEHPSTKVKVVWARVLGIEEASTSEILQTVADLIDLVGQTKADIARLEDVDTELYLTPFPRIEQILTNLNLEAKWQEPRQQLDETTLRGLQYAADKLSRETDQSEVASEDISLIKEELDELLDQITDSSLPLALPDYVILSAIEKGIC